MRRRPRLAPLALLAAAAAVVLAVRVADLAWNRTPSLPRGIYRLTYASFDEPLEPGDLVALCLPTDVATEGLRRGYLPRGHCPGGAAPAIKRVGAVGGQVVEIDDRIGEWPRISAGRGRPSPRADVEGGLWRPRLGEGSGERANGGVDGGGIRVDGVYLQPPAPRRDHQGRPLEPLPPGRYRLRPGELWLYTDHPDSWDSRFYGPVPRAAVLGTVRPLWTSEPDLHP